MGPALALAQVPLTAGILVAAALAAAAVLAPAPRGRAAATLAALVLTPILLVAHIWDNPQFRPFRERPLVALAIVVVGLVLLGAAAWVLNRRPGLFPVAALVAIPFRVPIESGGAVAYLLVPLYFVVGAGALAFAVPALRGPGRRGEDGESPPAFERPPDGGAPSPPARPPGALEWLLLGLVGLYALQSLYSVDFGKALEQVVFFYVPFALLFALLVRVSWTRDLLLWCLGAVAALALVFCLIGFVEFQRRTLLLNPQVIASNQFQSYFRVNSLFFDPNIFGRFLVMVMVAVVTVMVWAGRGRDTIWAAVVLAVLWCGLVLTLSQSSLAALLVGLAVLAALRWSPGWTVAVTVAAIVVGVAVVVAFPGAVRLKLNSQQSVESATSGRGELIAGGARLFVARPLAGWGSGAFEPQFRRREKVSSERAATASHTIPVTVAAEQGVIGLLVYVALLVAAFGRLVRGARGSPARAAIAAAFAALVVHTFLYAAFLEDPLSWALLAIGTALAWRERPGPERHPAEDLAVA